MDENRWYRELDTHSAVRQPRGSDRGSCGNCAHTGTPGSGDYGPKGVSGYWCRFHSTPVSGNKCCDTFRHD